ncbi:MAG: hypothetical protein ACYS8W_04960 [Planctomycetota bacterium]|jgi:hypothetical protein
MEAAKIGAAAVVIVGGFLFAALIWWITKIFAKVMTFAIPVFGGLCIYFMMPENPEVKHIVLYAAAGVLASAIVSAGYMATANIFEIEKRIEKLETIRISRGKRQPVKRPGRRPIQARQRQEQEVVEIEREEEEIVEADSFEEEEEPEA